MIDTAAPVDETFIDAYRPYESDILIGVFAKKFDWPTELTRRILRDAIRFLAICAIPTGPEDKSTTARVMVCPPMVDNIVDDIFLNTPLLMWLEEQFGVRLVHVPAYAHKTRDDITNNLHYAFTISMMLAAGYEIDSKIWPSRLPVNYQVCIAGGGIPPCHAYAL